MILLLSFILLFQYRNTMVIFKAIGSINIIKYKFLAYN